MSLTILLLLPIIIISYYTMTEGTYTRTHSITPLLLVDTFELVPFLFSLSVPPTFFFVSLSIIDYSFYGSSLILLIADYNYVVNRTPSVTLSGNVCNRVKVLLERQIHNKFNISSF